MSIDSLLLLFVALSLLPLTLAWALASAVNLAAAHAAWRLARALGRAAPYVLGSTHGGSMAFSYEVFALREAGKIAEAAALAKERVAEKVVTSWSRNVAIDILISAGSYHAALSAEPPPRMPTGTMDALGLALIQINLAEADYNLGRWDAAEARLRSLDLACWRFPIARAGLLQQRAWIAAYRGRATEALELCASMKPRWLPSIYRAEYYFTRAAALLAGGRIDEAAAAVGKGEGLAKRLSSKRNALFMRARVAAAREDWVSAERLCREAANHAFQGQGGTGLLLWAQALRQLGQHAQAEEALRLVTERDPESDSAVKAAESLAAAFGTRP
jgi:tetratricopeptide (TPR) repeat protein